MQNVGNFRRLAIAVSLALWACTGHAQVTVHDAWVRATVPQQKATGAFMRLVATEDMRLVTIRSPAAGVSELHEMKLEGQVMKMRAVAALELPAGKEVQLQPGGYHVMLMDLQQPVSVGSSVPLTLEFEGRNGKRQTLQVTAPAKALGAGHGGTGEHGTAGKGH